MPTQEVAARLSIFVSEGDYYRGRPVHELILELAREQGLSSITVFRGWAGFGASGEVNFSKRKWSLPRTMVVEIIDRPGVVDEFLAVAEEALRWALVTREAVVMTRYGRVRRNSQ